jgi:hypothetical protein
MLRRRQMAGGTGELAACVTASPGGEFARLRLRFLHWLVTPGGWAHTTDAARLRGWARVLRWHAATTPVQRFHLILRALWTPVRTWGEARDAVKSFGAEVEAASGVSPRTQRRQLWWLAVRHGMNATSYLDYQLYRPERHRRARSYLQEDEFYSLIRWLNQLTPRTDGYPIADKLAFCEWCQPHGLPAIPTLLVYDVAARDPSALASENVPPLPHCDLFSKPVDDTGGRGSARWRYAGAQDGADMWIDSDGTLLSSVGLLRELARISQALPRKPGRGPRRILLQPCIRNHRDLLPLTKAGLCTVRVVTYRMPGGSARVLLAAYKMPVGDSPADNFHSGGIVAPVDLATGKLGRAIRRQGHVLMRVDRHPDTGVTIPGHQLPYWPETLALATRALNAGHSRPSIGWDIAITDDGPILVEGNTMSNPDIAQAPTGIPLSDTPFPAAIDAHVQRAMELR